MERGQAEEEWLELRRQIAYWQAMHKRAVEREAEWKEQAERFGKLSRDQQGKLDEVMQIKEKLEARVAWLEQQLFGRKSEQGKGSAKESEEGKGSGTRSEGGSEKGTDEARRRPRGKQPGTRGYGRKKRSGLATRERVHEIPEPERRCGKCGKAFSDFPGTEDSEVIEWKVVLERVIHRRRRYQARCDCPGLAGILTAPGPAKLIPKGLFGVSFWVELLLEKFLFQRPVYRVRQKLEMEGLEVSQGTLTGGLKRILEVVQPLYALILERGRWANHWQMDETRWSVFEEIKGKIGFRWWLWVWVTREICAYILDPSRSAEVPKRHLVGVEGILNADRYSAYKTLRPNILVAFCWSHVRRDFVKVRQGYRRLKEWAKGWIDRIDRLFKLNDRRVAEQANPEEFAIGDRAVREAVEAFKQAWEDELTKETLHPAQKKPLVSLREHWEGLILFVEHPEVPMDNNESERRLRNPIVGRKNYYGSGAVWSGQLAAVLFTIMQTLLLNGLDPKKVLQAYLEACARAGGRPPENPGSFLPWNLAEERKAAWRYGPPRPP